MGEALSFLAGLAVVALAWGHGVVVGMLWPEVVTALFLLRDGEVPRG